MIVSTKKLILISTITSILISGCASPTVSDDFSKTMTEINDDGNISIDGMKMPNLEESYKNFEKVNDSFTLSYATTVNDALRKLSVIDKRQYYLHPSSENIILPPSNITIKSFADLKNYVEDVLEKTVFISKNAVIRNRLKVVEIRDVREAKNDINKIKFSLNTSMTVEDALKQLSEEKSFDFSISIDNDDFESENSKKIFQSVYMNFKGDNVSSFFDYLEKKLNIYVAIDYKHKIVTIKKYNKKTFALDIPNIKMTVNTDNSDTQVTADAGEATSSISETKELNTYQLLSDSFDKIITESKARGNNNSYYIIDIQTGIVSVYADKKTLTSFAELINKTNNSYKDMVKVEILTFDVVFSKSYLFQTSFTTSAQEIGSSGAIVATSSVTSVVNQVFSLSNKGAAEAGDKTSFLFESLQKFGYIANKQKDTFILRNNIPDSDSSLETERYLKNIITIDPVVQGDTAKQTTETDLLKKPNSYNITAHYNDGMISLDLKTSRGTVTEIGELGSGTNKVSNPKTRSTENTDHIYMKNGESFITASKMNMKKSADFNGLVPTEWLAANILGGGKSDSALYTQTITIISAKKINNL